jgi:hypothetical protein
MGQLAYNAIVTNRLLKYKKLVEMEILMVLGKGFNLH